MPDVSCGLLILYTWNSDNSNWHSELATTNLDHASDEVIYNDYVDLVDFPLFSNSVRFSGKL